MRASSLVIVFSCIFQAYIPRGLYVCVALEESSEVLGIFEAEGIGGLGGGESADHEALGTVNEEMVDGLRGAFARDRAYYVAEVIGRKAQL